MKLLFRVLVVAALAVALGIFARANSGYVQIAMPQTFSLEWSLNFFIIVLLAAFFLFYGLLRSAGVLWDLPKYWRRRNLQRRQAQALRRQNEALLALWREDAAVAQKAMAGVAETPGADGVLVLLAAQAALRAENDEEVQRLLRHESLSEAEYEIPRILIEAERLLRQQRPADALSLLRELRIRTGLRTAAGRLELQALLALQQREAMTALLDDLQRGGKMCETEARSWLCGIEGEASGKPPSQS